MILDLLHAYHALALAMMGLGLAVGLVSRKRALHALRHTVLMMLAMPIVLSVVSETWAALSFGTQFALIAVGIPLAALGALVGTSVGREFAIGVASNAAYDGIRRPGCLRRSVAALVVLAFLLALAL